ncbi:hypothetical protein BC939DRAFT_117163 [Gamsiella multidivaricata]|uniref:uncharacterized protein n=1 Tax=Gamsiella multidivaricata TaxID=101098 RepID=UPI00221E4ED1|nr:uncharacterized protein BC939DRAFT_117163 [Gamsiella multidivaricata]KAI7826226.1 hypothetical protein BC939DRAFT_117163 [Gamsiella multidivaricata]
MDGFEYMEFSGRTGREPIEAYIPGLRDLLHTEEGKQALDELLRPKAIKIMSERLLGRFRPIIMTIERIIGNVNPDNWQNAIDVTESMHCLPLYLLTEQDKREIFISWADGHLIRHCPSASCEGRLSLLARTTQVDIVHSRLVSYRFYTEQEKSLP